RREGRPARAARGHRPCDRDRGGHEEGSRDRKGRSEPPGVAGPDRAPSSDPKRQRRLGSVGRPVPCRVIRKVQVFLRLGRASTGARGERTSPRVGRWKAIRIQYKWTVLTVTTVGVLMAGLDSRIVIIGLPQVAASLHADPEQAIWITQAYVLGSTVALLLIGRVSDITGRVKLYTSGFGVFTLGSLLTSIAVNPAQVIAFRAVQGLGSAILFTNSAAMIVDATPAEELGLSLGINQVAFRMGSMAGLTVSGIILSVLDWRALFYVNVPIGVFGTAWARFRLREVAKLERGAPIDWGGFAAFTIFILFLLIALTLAAYGVAEVATVAVLLVVSILALVAFVVVERSQKHPLLDLKLLRIREFTGGVAAQLLNAVAFGAVLLLVSLYFQLVLRKSPLEAGLLIIPMDIATLAAGPLSGRLSDKYGHLPFTTAGLATISLSLVLFATTDANPPYSLFVVYLSLAGLNTLAILPSMLRGRRANAREPKAAPTPET